jgi:poly-gamma-glutamate synthesis protein (capsule biosynthesis protein)
MKVALAGDTMLGRGVATTLRSTPPEALFAPAVVEAAREADLFLLNLECAISDRGSPWPDPSKPFFFRAPPSAVEALLFLGVDCVTLANNHALDFGEQALLDTFEHLERAGIAWVGAGERLERARAPVALGRGGCRLTVLGVTDHPAEYGASADRPGVAYANLTGGVPDWLLGAIRAAVGPVLVTPHWGPNMAPEPLAYVRTGAAELLEAGATLVAGHSAHVFQGVGRRVLFDLGDFIDDYAVDPFLRNDLGLLFLVTIEQQGPTGLEAIPLKLAYCRTHVAAGDDAAWIERRFRRACAALGTDVRAEAGRLVVTWS